MTLFFAGLLLLAISSIISAAAHKNHSFARLTTGVFSTTACGFIFLEALGVLLGADISGLSLPGPTALLAFHFEFTPLSAFFTMVISALGIVTGIHSLGYSAEYENKAGYLGFFYGFFLLFMLLVPVSANAFTFLFCWEMMTLTSFFLVMLEHEKAENRKAGYLYLIMSHAGTVFIFLLFFLLYRATGSMEFDVFRMAAGNLPGGLKTVIFLMSVIGFGTKAGIVPLHIWLPYAHPAAPSHVSALMSGVMIKTAIYGFLMVVFQFLGCTWWWGIIVLLFASASAILGIMYALVGSDMKKILAYCSVENIGIIFMGIGAGIIFSGMGYKTLACLAVTASLFHVANHAAIKGLLFLAAGSVIKSVHTRNIELLGGLIKKMPWTAFCFLIGALAISGLPPLNGFASEWLIFQSLLSGLGIPAISIRILCFVTIAALALTGGMAAASFVKLFGITFLAQPRSEHAEHAKEASGFEIAALLVLTAACAVIGLFPDTLLSVLAPVAKTLVPALTDADAVTGNAVFGSMGSFVPAVLFTILTLSCVAAYLAGPLLGGKARVRRVPTWACGQAALSPRMEYSAVAFSKPFRMIFAFIYQPARSVTENHSGSPYFVDSIVYVSRIRNVILGKLYRMPLKHALHLSHKVRAIQSGEINLYLGYICATLAGMLIFFLF